MYCKYIVSGVGEAGYYIDTICNCGQYINSRLPVVLGGWILSKNITISTYDENDDSCFVPFVRVSRLDVVSCLGLSVDSGLEYCGFETAPFFPKKNIVINGVSGNKEEKELLRIILEQYQDVVPIVGIDDYLFLGNDKNDSEAQYVANEYEEGCIKQWKEYVQTTVDYLEKLKIKHSIILAPAKEEIFEDYYPRKKGSKRLVDRWINEIPNVIGFNNRRLKRERYLAYNRVETHWSHYGACLVVEEFISQNELKPCTAELKYEVQRIVGDLGYRLSPAMYDAWLTLVEPDRYIVYNNNIINHGNLRVYVNENAENKISCLLFGDSFGVAFAEVLSFFVRKVVYAYSPAIMVRRIVDTEHPDIVLLQTNQRFLVNIEKENYWIESRNKKGCHSSLFKSAEYKKYEQI